MCVVVTATGVRNLAVAGSALMWPKTRSSLVVPRHLDTRAGSLLTLGGQLHGSVLVTGGAGFIGSALVSELAKRHPRREIWSLDNYFTGNRGRHIAAENVRYLDGDTRDIWRVYEQSCMAPPDIVYHLGEYARIAPSFEDFEHVWSFNIHGTKEVAEFCRRLGARLVYAGSSSIFGNDGEDQHLNPYSWSKAKNVELIRNLSDWSGLDSVITYFYNVYGPGQICEGPYASVIGIFESQYRDGKPLTVVSPGTQTRDFTHVSDIVDGIILCAELGSGDGYHLGRGEELALIEVAHLFGADVELIPPRRGERLRGKSESAKARSLGWTPYRSLREYVEDFVKSTDSVGSRCPERFAE